MKKIYKGCMFFLFNDKKKKKKKRKNKERTKYAREKCDFEESVKRRK